MPTVKMRRADLGRLRSTVPSLSSSIAPERTGTWASRRASEAWKADRRRRAYAVAPKAPTRIRNRIPYQNRKVHRMDLNTGDVPLIPPGLDEPGAQLAPQVRNVDVDHIRKGVPRFIIQAVINQRTGHELSAVQRQQFHQGVLLGGQLDAPTFAPNDPGHGINLDVSDPDQGRRLPGGTPDEGLETGDELSKLKRLGQVVVSTRVQALEFVVHGIASGENEDRYGGCLAELEEDFQPPQAREEEVKNDGIVDPRLGLEEPALPVRGGIDGDPLLLQRLSNSPGERRFVLDDENPHRSVGRRAPRRPRSPPDPAVTSFLPFPLPSVRISSVSEFRPPR